MLRGGVTVDPAVSRGTEESPGSNGRGDSGERGLRLDEVLEGTALVAPFGVQLIEHDPVLPSVGDPCRVRHRMASLVRFLASAQVCPFDWPGDRPVPEPVEG